MCVLIQAPHDTRHLPCSASCSSPERVSFAVFPAAGRRQRFVNLPPHRTAPRCTAPPSSHHLPDIPIPQTPSLQPRHAIDFLCPPSLTRLPCSHSVNPLHQAPSTPLISRPQATTRCRRLLPSARLESSPSSPSSPPWCTPRHPLVRPPRHCRSARSRTRDATHLPLP